MNAIDLRGLSEKERSHHLDVALYEEYTGVFGISWERGFVTQSQKAELYKQEVADRLRANMVFVLSAPPIKSPATLIPGDNNHRSRWVYHREDGPSQVRGELLTTQQNALAKGVTEIKTSQSFRVADIQYILVPNHLFDLAQDVFTSPLKEKIISVSDIEKTFTKSPEILKELFGTSIQGRLRVQVPNYEKELMRLVEGGLVHFSLHCLRLTTAYDLEPRFFASAEAREWLEGPEVAGTVVQASPDQSTGWAIIPRIKRVDRAIYLEKLVKAGVDIKSQHIIETKAFYDKVIQTKGTWTLTKTPCTKLSVVQHVALSHMGVCLLNQVDACDNFWMAIPKELFAQRKSLLQQAQCLGKEIEASARVVQRHVRRYLGKCRDQRVRGLEEKVIRLEAELAQTKADLDYEKEKRRMANSKLNG